MANDVKEAKQTGAILIAASIITTIRLRGAPIVPSPKLRSMITESVALAQLILSEINK